MKEGKRVVDVITALIVMILGALVLIVSCAALDAAYSFKSSKVPPAKAAGKK